MLSDIGHVEGFPCQVNHSRTLHARCALVLSWKLIADYVLFVRNMRLIKKALEILVEVVELGTCQFLGCAPTVGHWFAKVRIAQLKMKRPTLKEYAKGASDQHNVYKFCHDIIKAHRTGAMGGKPALWDYLRDVASNLNRSKQGFRWSTNSKAFSQAMKIYGGRRMCELFELNYAGPNPSTTKRENQKGVQFVHGEHVDIFQSVAKIYKDAKAAHGIVGPVLVILVEDETKVKG